MDNLATIIDNGSSTIRAGFAGDEAPQLSFSTVTGRTRFPVDELDQQLYVGDDAQSKRDLLAIQHPIHRGEITDWEAMEAIWQHTFNLLNARPEDHPVCLTAAPLTSRYAKEKMAQIMCETFHVPALHIGNQGMLSLYAFGRTSGVIVGSGDGITFCMPVHNGQVIPEGVARYRIAGSDLTQHLKSLLTEQGYGFLSTEEEIARDIKEKHCYVAANFNEEMSTSNLALSSIEADYAMPDGRIIPLRQERFVCPEALFQPYLLGAETSGIHKVIYNSVMQCDAALHDELFGNIVLAGGNTTLPGFTNRLQRELTALRNETSTVVSSADVKEYAWVQKAEAKAGTNPKTVRVISPPEAKDSAWLGGALLCSVSGDEAMWLTKAEYEEGGPSVVRHKFT
ncbi:actin, clone 302-like [Paramacrobiotus metropolitanus]|uniref:actin, clone 302-like n=1 Tax=Paramacrobiotus metropolitanus TaxID=2943436 RepID=UPI0024464C91|nr:actin, clone 302-like [Paramacrobiotus metropolitanus]